MRIIQMCRRRRAKGSATVELSVLMPIICILIMLLLYLGLYLYNRTVLYGDAYLAAYRAVFEADASNGDAYLTADRQMQEQISDQLAVMDVVQTDITVTYDKVRISYEGTMEVPFLDEQSYLSEWKLFILQEEVCAERHKPVTFIRQCRKLEQQMEEE